MNFRKRYIKPGNPEWRSFRLVDVKVLADRLFMDLKLMRSPDTDKLKAERYRLIIHLLNRMRNISN